MRRKSWTESGYCFQLCGGNQFPFCHATETAGRIGTRKDGTALIIGAIPPNLKLLPSNRKPLILQAFFFILNRLLLAGKTSCSGRLFRLLRA